MFCYKIVFCSQIILGFSKKFFKVYLIDFLSRS